jgi:acetyl coenzyme A synthetase (ADP forming)-like protein
LSASRAARYPAEREADVVLRDGSTAHVRPVRPADEPALATFLEGMSAESRQMRFFTAAANLEGAAHSFVDVDYRDRFGLVATTGEDGEIAAHAAYLRIDAERAEVAFEVADRLRGEGIATTLLAHLAEVASAAGIDRFEADVLPGNWRMLAVFRESGLAADVQVKEGRHVILLPTAFSEEALDSFEGRERTSAEAAVSHFLRPSSVAVIGASRRRGAVGGELLRNLLEAGFEGAVYAVNPSADNVQGLPAYRSVLDVEGDVELAVVVVAAEGVVEVARECARKGVRALLVVSGGFSEAGADGRRRQQELLAVCRDAGMRLVGPNCLGVLNTERHLDATFGPTRPPAGRVGLLSQSGAVGLALIEEAGALGLGLSSFVSSGNKPDISGNDLLEYWEGDSGTDVILLYLESFGNPRRFARIARRVSRAKPIVAVKSGRSAAGARAAASHTGALVGASDIGVEALFRQAGVVHVETLSELFDVGSLLASQPLPAGRRVGIVTNSGGPGILCADACQAGGLEVVELSQAARTALAALLPPSASAANPVDMLAEAGSVDYERTIAALADSGEVDAIVAIFTPALQTGPEEVEEAVARCAASLKGRLPVLTVLVPGTAPRRAGPGPPCYGFPEDAIRALAAATRYSEWRRAPRGSVPHLADVRPEEASRLVERALEEGPRWLRPQEVNELLSCYGLPLVDSTSAATSAEAGAAAARMGGGLVLKAVSPTVLHKTEAGAVRVGLSGDEEVRRAAEDMAARLTEEGHDVEGFIVQREVEGGVEMIAGVTSDPLFGPLVACGAGGTTVELVHDVAVRITPLTDLDAKEMVRSLRTFPLLDGYRGAPKADVAALELVLLRLGAMVEAHPEVAELDCNPVLVHPEGAVVVDARVRLASAPMRHPWPALGSSPPATSGEGPAAPG